MTASSDHVDPSIALSSGRVVVSALLGRLEAIGRSLAADPCAQALLGLGSVGVELGRLDEYSDLDFFAVVDVGSKQRYLDSLDWLSRVHPIEFTHRNTIDGYKVMFTDGIFAEFAVFEPWELAGITFPPSRVVWAADRFDRAIAEQGTIGPAPTPAAPGVLIDEALTNLYIGLLRERRGEHIAAFRMIQVYAVDRVMELAGHVEEPVEGDVDRFGCERRFETRFPVVARHLPSFTQGSVRNGSSAVAILEFLEQEFEVDPAMALRIRGLVDRPDPTTA